MWGGASGRGSADLRGTGGAAKIGRGASNVDADLTALEGTVSELLGSGDLAHLSVVDMHFGALRGVGWISTENGSTRSYDVASAAAEGATTIVLTANASEEFGDAALVVGQLIVYLGDDGYYRTVLIDSVTGVNIGLAEGLEADLSAGVTVFNFWANESHPNAHGYKAIVDYAALNLLSGLVRVSKEPFIATGGATVTTANSDTADNVGSSTFNALDVEATAAGYTSGVACSFEPGQTGAYICRMKLNTGGVSVQVAWSAGGYSASRTYATRSPKLIEMPFFVSGEYASLQFTVTPNTSGETFNISANAEFMRVETSKPNLNRGKHVLLGDSWIAQMGAVGSGNLWFENRFDQATFVNSGVGGNTAAQAVTRFNDDVAAHAPDYVWLMVSTNDIYGGVAPSLFSYYLGRFLANCAEIGAHAILFTPYVGSASASATRFALSRRYAEEVFYFQSLITGSGSSQRQLITFPETVVAAGARVVLAELGRHAPTVLRIYESYFSHDIDVGEKTTITGAATTVSTITGNTHVTTDADVSHTANRFLQLSHLNSTGSPVTLKGYAVVRDDAAY